MRSNGNSQVLTVRLIGHQRPGDQDVLQWCGVEAHMVRVPGGTEWRIRPGITLTYRAKPQRPWWCFWRSPRIYLTALRVSEPKEVSHLFTGEVSLKMDRVMLRGGDAVTIALPETLLTMRGG
jgi:hypothetical protein